MVSDINPDKKPEGQIWFYTGANDVVVGENMISGKGTIVVKGKNIKISGSLRYDKAGSSIGFICLEDATGNVGKIEIEKNVNDLVGDITPKKNNI